jgi:hypothetical protein
MDDIGKKAGDALHSDKGEQASDKALGGAADRADSATGGKHGDQIDKAQNAADSKLGDK